MSARQIQLSGRDLRFDAGPHHYFLPTGERVPGVTEILRATGTSIDFEGISTISDLSEAAVRYRRHLGTAVHADCHAFDDGQLAWDRVHPAAAPYVKAWEVFRENSRLEPLERERVVFHAAEYYCGALDGIFRQRETRGRVLIDIKLGDPFDAAAHLQTAAYLAAHEAEHGRQQDDPIERWAVQLFPDRRIPYDVTPYTDWRDASRWLAVVATFYEQPDQRRHRSRFTGGRR